MLIKRIKAFFILCSVLIFTLPTMSYAMDKDEFLKFLVNSSYPETKTEQPKEDKEESVNTSNTQDKEYIKFHIGEENIPTVNNEQSTDKTIKEDAATSITALSSKYQNDIRVTNNNPRILLYHTHSAETYSNSPGGNYHSKDKANSVMSVGELITEELNKKGWGVVHTTKYHDYPSYNGSYASSHKTIQELTSKYNSIDIAIDIHRDARDIPTEELKKKEENRLTTTINGEKVAKFLFVVGSRNPNVDQVRSLAQDITKFAQAKYPNLVLPVVEKPYGKFNQFMVKNHLLIEIGSNGTTAQEAQATAKYVAQVLDEYFKTK